MGVVIDTTPGWARVGNAIAQGVEGFQAGQERAQGRQLQLRGQKLAEQREDRMAEEAAARAERLDRALQLDEARFEAAKEEREAILGQKRAAAQAEIERYGRTVGLPQVGPEPPHLARARRLQERMEAENWPKESITQAIEDYEEFAQNALKRQFAEDSVRDTNTYLRRKPDLPPETQAFFDKWGQSVDAGDIPAEAYADVAGQQIRQQAEDEREIENRAAFRRLNYAKADRYEEAGLGHIAHEIRDVVSKYDNYIDFEYEDAEAEVLRITTNPNVLRKLTGAVAGAETVDIESKRRAEAMDVYFKKEGTLPPEEWLDRYVALSLGKVPPGVETGFMRRPPQEEEAPEARGMGKAASRMGQAAKLAGPAAALDAAVNPLRHFRKSNGQVEGPPQKPDKIPPREKGETDEDYMDRLWALGFSDDEVISAGGG